MPKKTTKKTVAKAAKKKVSKPAEEAGSSPSKIPQQAGSSLSASGARDDKADQSSVSASSSTGVSEAASIEEATPPRKKIKVKQIGGKFVAVKEGEEEEVVEEVESSESVGGEVTGSQAQVDMKSAEIMPDAAEASFASPKVPIGEEYRVPLEEKNMRLWIVGLLIFILVVGFTGGLLFYRFRLPPVVEEDVVIDVEEESVAEVEETIIVDTSLDPEEISLEILNGSGIAGLAGQWADVFEALGYEIVLIGNGDETEVHQMFVQEGLEDELDKLLDDVAEELSIATVSGYLEDSTASARIILGSE